MPIGVSNSWQVRDERGRRKYVNSAERSAFMLAAGQQRERDQALCLLLAQTGCRISEALAVTREDLDRENLSVTFRTLKRRRLMFRTVPLPADLFALICRLGSDTQGRFWPQHRASAWRLVKAVMNRAGITGPMATCKGLRHGFAMHAIVRAVPANLVQRWLGHSSSTTTAIYLDAVGIEERQFAERMWST